jgi:hypothetical protein
MELASLLLINYRDRVTESETLPEYLNRVHSPSPYRPRLSPEDRVNTILDAHIAESRAERAEQAAYDKAAMLERIRARKQTQPNRRLDEIEAALTTGE